MGNNLNILIKSIMSAPLWVKEVIFYDIKKHLQDQVPNIESTHDQDIYSVYVPEITFKGKKELETHEHGHELNLYKYLSGANNNLRVVDITLNNFWTLEESSRYLAACIKNEYIKSPANLVVNASIFYLGNEIRLGEYVKRINLIDVNQLEAALRKQKEINANNHSYEKLGTILVNMGYIVSDDIVKILHIKDESQKRFIFPSELSKSTVNDNSDSQQLQARLEKLTQENSILKEKLRAIFNIQNKTNA